MISFKEFLLLEGGIGGHMNHPFDIASDGKDLVERFIEAIAYIKKNQSTLKIDGINISVRMVNGEFVVDRGSTKQLDITGTPISQLSDRFGEGHGIIEPAKKTLTIFNKSIPTAKQELSSLGLLKNENLLLNVEYVSGKTNVIKYNGIENFLVIHGIKEINPSQYAKKRTTTNVSYNNKTLNDYISKVNRVAEKYNFVVLGPINIKLVKQPNLIKILNEKLTLNNKTKTLSNWLNDVVINLPLITKKEYVELSNSDKTDLNDKQLNDYIVYYATIKLGQEILDNVESAFGDMQNEEGIVVKRSNGELYKITGNFILTGMNSPFKRK